MGYYNNDDMDWNKYGHQTPDETWVYQRRKSFDSFLWGFVPSFILPLLILTLMIYRQGVAKTVPDILVYIWLASANYYFLNTFILSMLPNMFLFLFFYKTERWKGCYGLVLATMCWFIFFIIRQIF